MRRFQARPAVGGQGIIDEGDEDHENGGRSNGAGLLDLLNSPPPWPQEDEQPPSSSSAPTSPARRASRDDAFHPMSIAMRTQNSQNSVQTVSSTMSSVSDVSEWLSQDPKTRQGPLKAKDERKDLAHERQINHDLADFFSNSPPPPSISSFPTTNAHSTVRGDDDWPSPLGAAASIKSSRKKTFSSFFGGNKGAKKSPDSEDGGLTRSSSIMSKATSVGRKTSRTRLNSNADPAVAAAAAMRASGFSDAAIRTASYSPPPNLAPSPSLDSKSTRRVSQVMPPPSHAPVVHERGSSIPGLKTSNKSVLSTSTHRSDETDTTATRRTSNSGAPRSLGAPSSLATISSPPAVPVAESSLAPALYGTPQHTTEPSPHLSIAPSFQTARDGFDEAESSPAPTQKSKLTPAVIALAGVAGVAALAGGTAAMASGRKSSEEQREAPAPLSREARSSALDDHQSRAIASGIAMASQDLGYRSSNEGFNGPSGRSREASNSSSVLTAGPSPTSAERPVAVDSLAPMRTLANSSAVEQSSSNADADSNSSETLTSLKQRMAAAQSPAECVALLEAFMAQQQTSVTASGVVSGAAGVGAPSGAVNGAEVAEAQEMLQVQEEKVAAEEAEGAAAEVAQASEEAERAIEQEERVAEKPHSQRMESWLSGFVASGGWSSFAAERDAKVSGGALSPVEERKEEVLEEKSARVAEEQQEGPVDQFERRMSLS